MSYNFVNTLTQYISCSSSLTLYPSTFSAWVYIPSRVVGSPTTILTLGVSTNANSGRIFIAGVSPYAPGIGSNQQGVSNVNTAGSIGTALNTWHHICGLFTSSTDRAIYLDGASVGTSTTASSPSGFNSIRIAANYGPSGGPTAPFLGRISEAAIWGVALTTDEINSLSKGFSPKRIRPQSLKFYCPLIRDLNEQILNSSLTNNNTATVTDHTRVYL